MKKKSKQKKIGWIVMLVMLFGVSLMGCSATELEERCFPMLVTVGYDDGKISYGVAFPKQDTTGQSSSKESEIRAPEVSEVDFAAARETYENRLNKEVDYNHMKVLVFEDEILNKRDIYEAIIADIIQTEVFPRNTYVCVVDDMEDLFELENYVSQDLGSYMEEYIKKHEKDKAQLLTLGDLMNENANQTTVLFFPYLDVEDKYIEWKGYMNTHGKTW